VSPYSRVRPYFHTTAPITRLSAPAGSRTFRRCDTGARHRSKAITAFPLHAHFAAGIDVRPFLRMVQDEQLNEIRGLLYTPVAFWGANAWAAPPVTACCDFADLLAEDFGLWWECCYVTDDRPDARTIANQYAALLDGCPNVSHELVNEPARLPKAQLLTFDFTPQNPWTNGEYDRKDRIRGTYGNGHEPRDPEWARKAKNLEERFSGGGPDARTDPAFPKPWRSDEPAKPGIDVAPIPDNYLAHAAIASCYGGGCYHYESGKYGLLPQTADEWACLRAFARGLNAFPLDVADYAYEHQTPWTDADEQATGSLRTYRWGPYGVRVPPVTGTMTAPVLIGA